MNRSEPAGRRDGRLWLTWEFQRRNRGLARAFGARLVEWGELDGVRPRWWKYLRGTVRTWSLLLRERPALVFCQSSSLFLPPAVLCLRPLLRYRVVVDAHNAGLFPLEGRSRLLNALAAWNQRHADLTVVSNAALGPVVEGNGGRAVVLPDPIPTLPAVPPLRPEPGRIRFLFVCTYAADEPYREVIAAAAGLPPEHEVLVTGDPARADLDTANLPPQVRCTGFVSEDEYVGLLRGADIVVVLTSRDNCLVCGAYEAVAAGRPMVLSDTPALRAHFREGVVFTGHGVAQLRDAMLTAARSRERMQADVERLRRHLVREWELQAARLEGILREMAGA